MQSNISKKLDIFLITFNRCKKLDKTLGQLLSENSPIRNFEIKIIDNCSTDNTEEIVKKYQTNFPNLKYEKNKYNIGGTANIVKAFYKAQKEYVWILADNDYYNWENWQDVIDKINESSDAIVVSTYDCPKENIAHLFTQTSFLPGVIYKTSNIDDSVITNMEYNISNLFPHLALSAKLINESKKIDILDEPIVIIGDNHDDNGEYNYTRDIKGYIHPLNEGMNWIAGFSNSLHLIKNKKTRNYIAKNNHYLCSLDSAKIFMSKDKNIKGNLYNYFCIFTVLSPYNRLKFIINLLLSLTIYKICFIEKNIFLNDKEKTKTIAWDLYLLNFIKTKLFKKTIKLKEVS